MKRKDIPWYHQNSFYIGVLIFFVVYAIILLPSKGLPSTPLDWTSVLLYIILVLGTVSAFLLDKYKPEWTKSIAVLMMLVMLCSLFYLYSGANWTLFGKQFFNLQKMQGRYHIFIDPFFVVLKIALMSTILTMVIGLIMAIFRSFDNIFINGFITAYVNLFRSFPSMVLIVLVYFALPYIGIELMATSSVVLALGLLFGAYATEIFRAGIEAIHHTQVEASLALGFNSFQTMRLVVLPQAIRIVIPPLTSLIVGNLKTTSIAYVVGVPELLARARQMQGTLNTSTPLLVVSGIYLLIVLPVVILSSYLEKQSKRWSRKAHV